jgi:hypothetical protein
MERRPQDSLALFGIGLFVGVFLAFMLSGRAGSRARETTPKWCLWFGAFSGLVVLLASLMGVYFGATNQGLATLLIGLPALSAGPVLHLFQVLVNLRNKSREESAWRGVEVRWLRSPDLRTASRSVWPLDTRLGGRLIVD